MTTTFIIAQVLSSVALILVAISYFVQHKTTFLLLHVFANVFYGAAFLVSQFFVPGLNTYISIVRAIVFYLYVKFSKKIPYYYVFIFTALYCLVGFIFYSSPWDILTTVSPILFTIAMVIPNLLIMKYCMLLPNMLLVVFNCLHGLYVSALLDILEIVVLIVAIVYTHIKLRKGDILSKKEPNV